MGRVADWVVQLAHGAVSRPRRALVGGVVAVVIAALGATQLAPTSPQGLLARSGSDVGAATIAQERAFGGEPVVVVLEGDVLNATLEPGNLERLLVLERRLAKLEGVKTVIGPATFVDRSVQQMFGVVEQEFGPAAERADTAARSAAAAARRSGKFTAEEVRQIGEETRLRALGPLKDQYQELFVRFGSIGMPSLTNRSFVAQLVLGSTPEPKKRFAWLFPDRSHSLIVMRPAAGLSDDALRRIGEQARRLVGRTRLTGLRTSVAGAPLVAAQGTSSIADELLRLMPIVLVAMALALVLGLGRRNRALHLLLPAGAAVLLTAGLSWPLGLGFTAATLAALPVVLGLAIDYVVQLQSRYWTERQGGLAPADAARAAVRRVGSTLLLAGGVMIAGFLALLLSPVPLVGRLGLTLAIGVACSLFCLFALAAPLMVATDRPGSPVPRLRLPDFLGAGARVRSGAIVAVIGVTLAGLALSGGAEVQSDVRRLADSDMPELQRLEDLQRELGTGGQIRVAVTGEKVVTPAGLRWMGAVEKEILALDPGLEPGPNLATILGTGGQGIPDAAAIPRLLRLIPPEFVGGILTADRRRGELSFGIPLGSAGEQAELIGRMQRIFDDAPAGITAQVAGLQALSASSVDGLQDGRPWLLLLCALVIFLLLHAARRDVVRAAIPLVPALFAAGATALLVEALGLELSPLSAGLDPLVLAVGVEFGLLLEARYHDERASGALPRDAARRTVELLGTPVAVAAGTVALGFLGLALSRLPVLQQFGLVAALELALCVVAAITLVPALAAATDRGDTEPLAAPLPARGTVVSRDAPRYLEEPVA